MKSFKKAFFVTLLCLVMVFSMLPLQAFGAQADLSFSAPFAEPYVGDNAFYIEVLFQDRNNPDRFNVHVYAFQYYVLYDAQPSTSVDVVNALVPTVELGQVSSTGNYVSVFFRSTLNHLVEAFYTCVDYSVEYNTVKYIGDRLVTDDYVENIDGNDTWKIVGLNCKGILPSSTKQYDYTFTVSYNNSDNTYAKLQEILNQLFILVANDETKIQALNDMLFKLNTLISNTDEIESKLDVANTYLKFIRDYVSQYFPEMTEVLWYIDNELFTVIEKLDAIIDLLQPDTEVNVSTLDPSNFNEYNKAEQSLLDNSNVDVSGALNVEIDQNALLFIWPLAERVLNTHPQVIGLVFTILSISLVALILGRKGGG